MGRLLAIVTFAFTGCATTILVAWVIASREIDSTSHDDSISTAQWPAEPPPDWRAPTPNRVYQENGPFAATTHYSTESAVATRAMSYRCIHEEFGFPLKIMSRSTFTYEQRHRPLEFGHRNIARHQEHQTASSTGLSVPWTTRRMPTDIRPLGFAISSMVYAGLAATLWAACRRIMQTKRP